MRPKKLNKVVGDFVTLRQLLQSAPLSERTIRTYIDKNKITAYKLNGKLIFNVLDIEAFLKRRRVGPPGEPILRTAEDRLEERAKQIEARLLDIARLTPEEANAFRSYRVLTDEEAQAFFANVERNDEGQIILHYKGYDEDDV